MKRIIIIGLAALLFAAMPLAAQAVEENRADIIVAIAAGPQEYPFRAADGGVARDVRDLDLRKWQGSAEVGARIGGVIGTLGVARTHTFAPDEGDEQGALSGIAGVGLASELWRTQFALLAYGTAGIPSVTERQGIGLGVMAIRGHWVAGSRYWPSTERFDVSLGLAF